MPELSEVYPTPLDLSRYSEATRRALYDRIVEMQFTPEDLANSKNPEDVWTPTQTPDEAGLTVFYLFGRWFAFWRDVPEPGLPEWRLTEMVRIQPAPGVPDGILLYEI
jgi:hypothetical protein